MKILIFTQYFPPEMGAPQARLFELASRFIKKGHEVTVLTAMPNYPTGKVFEGYRRRLRMVENMGGIKVVRTAIYPSKSSKALPRLLSYLSFVFSSVLIGWQGLGRHDVALVESPPLFIAPAGWIISKIVGARTVFMVSDIWPDIIVRMGYATGGLNLKAMFWLEKWAYRHYDVVALTNPGAMEQISRRFPEAKTTVISNGVDSSFFQPDFRSEETRSELGAKQDVFLVGYCGLHGLAQGLDVILAAAEHLKDRMDIRFIMMGDGPVKDQLIADARERGLANISFLDRRSKEEMPAILASCDALLVPLLTQLPGTMPSKVYESLASGGPLIVAEGCEGDSLVRQFDAGLTYAPMDGESLSKSILKIADDRNLCEKMRVNAIKLAKRYDRNVLADRTEQILSALVEGKKLPEVSW